MSRSATDSPSYVLLPWIHWLAVYLIVTTFSPLSVDAFSTASNIKISHRNFNIASKTSKVTAISFFRLTKTHATRNSFELHQSTLDATEIETAPTRATTKNVQFRAPLMDYGYPPAVKELGDGSLSQKPVLLYLPGFDGTYICPFLQFPELSTEFDVWCMVVGMDDRSTFDELKQNVLDFITTKLEGDTRRPLYLAGESFGGILASEVANELLSKEVGDKSSLSGLVLINPATCYSRSALQAKGPSVAKLPAYQYSFGLLQLLPLFTDEHSVAQLLLILSAKGLPSVIDTPAREAYMGRVAISLPTQLEYMPQETLDWRLHAWLATGCQQMESKTLAELAEKLRTNKTPTLIIAGEKDETLPSLEEADRLAKLFPKCHVHVVEGAGHASTCGSRVDLAAEMRSHFVELQSSSAAASRTAMKQEAVQGKNEYFGMTERYDKADIGLNPILYWSKENHQSTTKERVTSNNGSYSWNVYKPKKSR